LNPPTAFFDLRDDNKPENREAGEYAQNKKIRIAGSSHSKNHPCLYLVVCGKSLRKEEMGKQAKRADQIT
jgi:hypothetical protein